MPENGGECRVSKPIVACTHHLITCALVLRSSKESVYYATGWTRQMITTKMAEG